MEKTGSAATSSSSRSPRGRSQSPERRRKQRGSGACCNSGHALVAYETPQRGYACDACGASFAEGTTLHGCRACNFDLCATCCTKRSHARGALKRAPSVRAGAARVARRKAAADAQAKRDARAKMVFAKASKAKAIAAATGTAVVVTGESTDATTTVRFQPRRQKSLDGISMFNQRDGLRRRSSVEHQRFSVSNAGKLFLLSLIFFFFRSYD